MKRIRLIHWHDAEAKERAERLRSAGYEVTFAVPKGIDFLPELRESSPAALVIDLSRLPSHGRDVAMAVREQKSTRHVPVVFVEGDPAKVARIQSQLPDALYASWTNMLKALKRAIAHPPQNPVVPRSRLEGYSGTPLAKKLGIKDNFVVALIHEPANFRNALKDLPAGVTFRAQSRGKRDLTVWFVTSRKELRSQIRRLAALRDKEKLWIAWPKQAAGLATDLSQPIVREAGLATGLVDFKICAIDEMWSGLLFSRRKPK